MPPAPITASPAAVLDFVNYVARQPCVQPCEPGDPCVPCWARGLFAPAEELPTVELSEPSGGRVTGGA